MSSGKKNKTPALDPETSDGKCPVLRLHVLFDHITIFRLGGGSFFPLLRALEDFFR